ncbi:MAG: hypothetical protein DRJ03_22215 [Chloroflexi bacterium]|nr:MAG: hypothetical protein DRJ03_22215 [Chloroflexota bacterium]
MEGVTIVKVVVLSLCVLLLVGCATRMKGLTKSYDKFMKQADKLAAVLCSHSEFSVCYWQAALGDDISKMPVEAMEILNEIELTVKGKTVGELTECEKGKLLGLWQRFAYLVGKDVIKRVVPFMVKAVGVL